MGAEPRCADHSLASRTGSGLAHGRSLADRAFDPFWARVNEAGIAVTFHAGDSGYFE